MRASGNSQPAGSAEQGGTLFLSLQIGSGCGFQHICFPCAAGRRASRAVCFPCLGLGADVGQRCGCFACSVVISPPWRECFPGNQVQSWRSWLASVPFSVLCLSGSKRAPEARYWKRSLVSGWVAPPGGIGLRGAAATAELPAGGRAELPALGEHDGCRSSRLAGVLACALGKEGRVGWWGGLQAMSPQGRGAGAPGHPLWERVRQPC